MRPGPSRIPSDSEKLRRPVRYPRRDGALGIDNDVPVDPDRRGIGRTRLLPSYPSRGRGPRPSSRRASAAGRTSPLQTRGARSGCAPIRFLVATGEYDDESAPRSIDPGILVAGRPTSTRGGPAAPEARRRARWSRESSCRPSPSSPRRPPPPTPSRSWRDPTATSGSPRSSPTRSARSTRPPTPRPISPRRPPIPTPSGSPRGPTATSGSPSRRPTRSARSTRPLTRSPSSPSPPPRPASS